MKKELMIMLGAAMLGTVCCSNITANKVSAKTSGDYKYVVTGKKQKTCAIRKYTGKGSDVTVPEKIDGYTVTRIGNQAFKSNKSIKSVKLPRHVTIIGEKSFSGCSNLESITLSPKVHTIKKKAFSSCKNLNSIDFSTKLKKIGASAFSGCKSLKDIKLPDSVETIGNGAFTNCNMTSLYIPKNLGKTDLASVFNLGTVTKFTIADGNKYYDSRDNCNAVIETASNKLILATNNTTIPDSVTVIGSEAFKKCTAIKEITLPASVTSIEAGAFESCTGLEKINFSKGLKTIGFASFRYCTALKEISIPESVTSIGACAFDTCTRLEKIDFSQGLKTIGNSAFIKCKALNDINLPDSVEVIGQSAFLECDKVDSIYIPKNLGKTNFSKVFGCPAATKLVVSSGNKYYDSRDNCNAVIETASNQIVMAISTSTIPEGVESIKKNTFKDLDKLEEITIPSTVTSIDDYAFSGCDNLGKINLSEGLISIGDMAFCDCSSLQEIKLPDSVEEIGKSAFFNCESLKSIRIPKNLKKTDLSDIFDSQSIKEITVADGNKYYDSRNNCNAVIEKETNTLVLGCENTVIPKSVIVIGENAFMSAPAELVIPEGVEKISAYAISSDDSLKTVTLPVSLKEIGNEAFDYGLEVINYRGSKAQWEKIDIKEEKAEKQTESNDEDDEDIIDTGSDSCLDGVKINYDYKG